jgi:hypothetical protein
MCAPDPSNQSPNCKLNGISGFEVLGTNAAFATGKLTELLQGKELALLPHGASALSSRQLSRPFANV